MKKRVKRKINIVRILVFILVIVLLYFIIKHLFNMKTKNIVILNNSYYSDELIIETSSIENYPKFLALNKNKIKKDLLKLDLINDVKVTKKWNCILKIDVNENKILYYIRSKDMYKLSNGKDCNLDNNYNVPVLINYVPENVEEKFVKQLSKVDKEVISLISEIEYSKTSYDEERFLLYMRDGNSVYITVSKTDVLNKYANIVRKLDNKKGILYLDSGNYFEIKEK